MSFEKSGDTPGYDSSIVAYQKVRCMGCGEEYVCTPYSDYYSNSGAVDDKGIFVDGDCESCLLGAAGMEHIEDPIPLDSNTSVIGKPYSQNQ